jgi:uncharacterized protein with PIN domain
MARSSRIPIRQQLYPAVGRQSTGFSPTQWLWLRTIGIEVVIWGKEKKPPFGIDDLDSFPDRQSALLAITAREQRIILTRDKKLADRRDAGACFVVSSDGPQQQ